MQRFKIALLAFLLSLFSFGSVGLGVAAAPVNLVGSAASNAACSGLSQVGDGANCGGGAQSTIGKAITTIVKVLSVILGAAGVIMVVISGFKYITSGGDSGAVSSAKRTLIFALVGLAIAALAQFLVDFVFNSFKS